MIVINLKKKRFITVLLTQFCFPIRLPELRTVVILDGRQPGMFSLEEVMQAGSSRHLQQLQDMQKNLSCDDPINILLTSVFVPVIICYGSSVSTMFLSPPLTVFSRAPLGSQKLPLCLILISLTTPICLAKDVNMTGG